MDCVFIGPFDITNLSQYIFFAFSIICEFALVLRFGQNATFASLGSLLKAPVIQAMMIFNPRGHDEVLGSEPHCPQSGFLQSLIPSCEVFKHGFHPGGVDFFLE